MEVAGSAVGIASLGIQVCQGLLSYYEAWKSYQTDIAYACNKVEDLEKTFGILKSILDQPALEAEKTIRVQKCLMSCKLGIDTLEKKYTKLQAVVPPVGLMEKAKAATKRTLYPFKASTLAKIMEMVNDLLEHLSLAIQILQLDVSTVSHAEIFVVGLHVKDVANRVSDVKAGLTELRRDEKYRRVMSWLCAPDPLLNHEAARQKRHRDTGLWMLDSIAYKRWLQDRDGHLWVNGKAGCGKSVLCSTMIEDLKLRCRDAKDKALAFFYFSFSDADKQSYEKLLASLVFQLCTNSKTFERLKDAFDQGEKPSIRILEDALDSAVQQRDQIFVVLDALDELPEHGDRPKVLRYLQNLSARNGSLKLLMTSRNMPDIEEAVVQLSATQCPLPLLQVNRDIGNYVAHEF